MTGATKEIVIGNDERDHVERYIAERTARVGDCIEWTGTLNGGGRPIAHLPRGGARRRAVYAYRLVWTMRNGGIPAGLNICHRCDNPKCVNIAHLFLGTQVDNIRDMLSKGRHPGVVGHSGEAHHRVRHSDELVAMAQEMWATGRYGSYAELGRELGVIRGTVRSWVLGTTRTRKKVPA